MKLIAVTLACVVALLPGQAQAFGIEDFDFKTFKRVAMFVQDFLDSKEEVDRIIK